MSESLQPEVVSPASSRDRAPGDGWRQAALWCLRLTVALQCLGAARYMTVDDSSINSLLFINFGWADGAAHQAEVVLAWVLLVLAAAAVLAPAGVMLAVAGGVMLALAWSGWWTGSGHFPQWTLPAHAVRYTAPIALALMAGHEMWRRQGLGGWLNPAPASGWRFASGMWLLRIAAASTFIAHGVEAWLLNPPFVDYIILAGRHLLDVTITQAQAESALRVIAVVDVAVALLILTRQWRWVACWMAFWGLITAWSRIVAGGFGVYDRTLIRAANYGVPLAIALAWQATRKSKAAK